MGWGGGGYGGKAGPPSPRCRPLRWLAVLADDRSFPATSALGPSAVAHLAKHVYCPPAEPLSPSSQPHSPALGPAPGPVTPYPAQACQPHCPVFQSYQQPPSLPVPTRQALLQRQPALEAQTGGGRAVRGAEVEGRDHSALRVPAVGRRLGGGWVAVGRRLGGGWVANGSSASGRLVCKAGEVGSAGEHAALHCFCRGQDCQGAECEAKHYRSRAGAGGALLARAPLRHAWQQAQVFLSIFLSLFFLFFFRSLAVGDWRRGKRGVDDG
jgi:hypothetical protein